MTFKTRWSKILFTEMTDGSENVTLIEKSPRVTKMRRKEI